MAGECPWSHEGARRGRRRTYDWKAWWLEIRGCGDCPTERTILMGPGGTMSDRNNPAPAAHQANSTTASLRVTELWRYPVKSLLGERLPTLRLVEDGVEGDRMWGIQDLGDGRILTARREPRLLFASSRLAAQGVPV